MPASQLDASQDGRVLTVRLVNPPRNFMNAQMVLELDELTRRLEDDRSVGAVVLTGGLEDIFITHYDVAEILAGAGGPSVSATQAGIGLRAVSALEILPGTSPLLGRGIAAGLTGLRRIHEVFLRMNRSDKVFIAAINGLALGGGCELTLACDLRYMADGPGRIGPARGHARIIPGGGGTQRLARAIGPAAALELMLEGDALTAAEAQAAGVIHRAVPADRLLAEAQETAARLARRSPDAVRALKTAVYDGRLAAPRRRREGRAGRLPGRGHERGRPHGHGALRGLRRRRGPRRPGRRGGPHPRRLAPGRGRRLHDRRQDPLKRGEPPRRAARADTL
jgi:enoyl-CoA hydratase/carnithine racemase